MNAMRKKQIQRELLLGVKDGNKNVADVAEALRDLDRRVAELGIKDSWKWSMPRLIGALGL